MRTTTGRIQTTSILLALVAGCGAGDVPTGKPGNSNREPGPGRKSAVATDDSPTSSPKKKFKPVQLGNDADPEPAATTKSSQPNPTDDRQSRQVVAALQPFQVLLGNWRWTTKKKFGDFQKTGNDVHWVWDFQTDKNLPALAAHSDTNPYFHEVGLTYLPADDKFRLTLAAADDSRRILEGAWTTEGEPRDESDGKQLQRTYKLQLTQTTPLTGDQWQITFQQLDNNQYLFDLKKRSAAGKQFGPLDTVRQQREGTSFAVADSDNPGPKCIISGGLGTMSVSYKGKSYPVCCSGCAAAFNDDPERWLARFEAARKKSGE